MGQFSGQTGEGGVREESGKISVTVKIGGEEHVLRSPADPDYTRACAEYLDEQIRAVRERGDVAERHRAVLLAALAVTDRYFQAREELDRLRREVSSRSMNLVRRIEEQWEEEGRRDRG